PWWSYLPEFMESSGNTQVSYSSIK
ncbi:hypothetical protein CP8484711_0950B, partial [Chlamydia psittaci 84-8471/1]